MYSALYSIRGSVTGCEIWTDPGSLETILDSWALSPDVIPGGPAISQSQPSIPPSDQSAGRIQNKEYLSQHHPTRVSSTSLSLSNSQMIFEFHPWLEHSGSWPLSRITRRLWWFLLFRPCYMTRRTRSGASATCLTARGWHWPTWASGPRPSAPGCSPSARRTCPCGTRTSTWSTSPSPCGPCSSSARLCSATRSDGGLVSSTASRNSRRKWGQVTFQKDNKYLDVRPCSSDILPSEYGGDTSLDQMTGAWAEALRDHRDILLGKTVWKAWIMKAIFFSRTRFYGYWGDIADKEN